MPLASRSCASWSRSAGCWSGKPRRPRRRGRPAWSGSGCAGSSPRWRPARSSRPPSPLAIVARAPDALPAAAPFLVLWTIAPVVAYWLSVPVGARVRPLDDRERTVLRRTARKTWRYFETFVTEADAWLAPDNYQDDGDAEAGAPHVADQHRHEPAVDAGRARPRLPLDRRAASAALDATLATLEGLERYQRTLPQLVRHGDAGAAAPALRLDRRQRQPRRRADRARPGAPRDSKSTRRRARSGSPASPTRPTCSRPHPRRATHDPDRGETVTEINRLARAIVSAARAAGAPTTPSPRSRRSRRSSPARPPRLAAAGAVRAARRDRVLVPRRARRRSRD